MICCYDDNMDAECVDLCNAINRIPGLQTIESCCGHEKDKFRVYFIYDNLKYLPVLLYFLDPCNVGFNWNCFAITDSAMSAVKFYIESTHIGEDAYIQACIIASKITEHLDEDF